MLGDGIGGVTRWEGSGTQKRQWWILTNANGEWSGAGAWRKGTGGCGGGKEE